MTEKVTLNAQLMVKIGGPKNSQKNECAMAKRPSNLGRGCLLIGWRINQVDVMELFALDNRNI